MLAQWNEPEVRRFLFDGEPVSREMVRLQLASSQRHFAELGCGFLTLRPLRKPEQPIGFCGLRRFGERGDVEILYALRRAHWGAGLASEAAWAVLEHAFREAGLAEVYAGADPPNQASFRVMERLGMRPFGDMELGGRPASYYRIAREAFFERSLPRSPRLRFREMSLADLDFVAAMLADPEVMRFYPRPYDRDEAAAWVGRQLERYRRDGHGLWLVLDADDGLPRGQVGLLRQELPEGPEAEIGYLIHRPFWRRGLAGEAATATREHAFRVRHAARVISLIRPENLPSQAVARKLGMSVTSRLPCAGLEHLVFSLERS